MIVDCPACGKDTIKFDRKAAGMYTWWSCTDCLATFYEVENIVTSKDIQRWVHGSSTGHTLQAKS